MKRVRKRINAKAGFRQEVGPVWENTAASPRDTSWQLLLVQSTFRGQVEAMKKCVLISMIAMAVLWTASFTAAQEATNSRELVVAAAADLSSALKEVADGYEKQTGVKVKLSFGASGALTQQIQNGAPFDIFFSADMDYPRQLISAGEAEGASLYQYAVGKLVLWV